jgi:micrococcal nuclease
MLAWIEHANTFASVSFFVSVYCRGGFWIDLAESRGVDSAPHTTDATSTALCTGEGLCEPPTSSTIGLARPTSTVETNANITRVVDGDTFEALIDGQQDVQKVRMLGINTPETVDPRKPVECYGKEASNQLKSLMEGKRVRLEADPQADERDRYDRLLRNVILEDGTDVNARMVRDGFAYAYLSFPLDKQRKQELKTLQELARASGSGLWAASACGSQS